VGLAQIGFLTTVTEGAAAAVGAGAVLGGVAMGLWSLTTARPMVEVEEWALKGGYFGGGFGAIMALADVILRYGIQQ
jgi:hypothetical protein